MLRVKTTYAWSKGNGLTRELMRDAQYLTKVNDVDKQDMDGEEEPPLMPEGWKDIAAAQLKSADARLVVCKCNHAKLKGFRSGFAENFMSSMPKKVLAKTHTG